MKIKGMKKLVMCILAVVILIAMEVPAFAASATVNVEFIIKNQQGPYKDVSIQFGTNTKTTGNNGKVSFKLKNIPVTTRVNAFLVDPNVPTAYSCAVNLALGAHEDVQVNSTDPYESIISVMYTEYTKTIVIEFFVGHNTSYGYSSVEFEHKLFSQPNQQPNQQPIQQPNNDPNPPQGNDPDMHFDEPNFDEHTDNMNPDSEFYREPFMLRTMPGYVWIILIVGALLLITGIVLTIVLSRRKQSSQH
ncbi:MAG: hypothetical protein KAQ68_09060 [Clostridiales bacterium]|nr:hypothetical protein [Clostridiales bacterium]